MEGPHVLVSVQDKPIHLLLTLWKVHFDEHSHFASVSMLEHMLELFRFQITFERLVVESLGFGHNWDLFSGTIKSLEKW